MPFSLSPLSHSVSLHWLFPRASFVGCGDIVALDATEDSRQANSQTIFAAIPGTRLDGTQFAQDAVARGCKAILTERPLANVSVPQCVVPNVRVAYARLCDAIFGFPSRQLRISGVTGTNGKTTTAWLIRSILQAAGRRCGLLGTVEYHDGETAEPSCLTTPDARRFSQWFRRMVDHGCTHAAIEVSSHALDQGRVAGNPLAAAAVTNVTQDHFDYHGTFEKYLEAKLQIVDELAPSGVMAINADDPSCQSFLNRVQATSKRSITYGISEAAEVKATILDESLDGTQFTLSVAQQSITIQSPLPGRHNVSNCLAAAVIGTHLGASPEQIRDGIEFMAAVPGRLERVDCGQPYSIFVDYAHTDDALRRVVTTLKGLTTGRVLCVFGAGGDRDRTKRPKLAQAASLADVAIVTSDNPRTEQPKAIIEEILAGFPRGFADFHVDPDRRAAIEWALSEAGPGDCVLIAGKGHEDYQIIGTERFPFDDRQVVRDVLAAESLAAAAAGK